jgi:hypothetical protein
VRHFVTLCQPLIIQYFLTGMDCFGGILGIRDKHSAGAAGSSDGKRLNDYSEKY